jgi:hypothetical protein
MAPPVRRAAEPKQASGLCRHAVGRHQLLLFAHRVEEAQGVRAEADQPQRHEHDQGQAGGRGHLPPFARSWWREQQEGQRQAGGDLDRHARHQRDGGRPKARLRSSGERQGAREQHDDQRVVVRATHRQHEQHGVQAHEGGCPAARVTEPAGRPRDQGDGTEARRHGDGLERPQRAGQAQGCCGVAREREQRPVGGVQEGPSDEPEDLVGGHFGGDVRIGVKAVQRSQAGEAHVAEDILGDQRRPQQQDQICGHDRREQGAHGQRARREQDEQVARRHDQHEVLKARVGYADAEALQRPSHPARPAAAASRDVLRGSRGGARRQQKDAREDAQQPERAEHLHGARAPARPRGCIEAPGRFRGGPAPGCGDRGVNQSIVTSRAPASVRRAQ